MVMLDQNKRSSILKIENSSKRNGKRHLIVTNEGSYKGDWKNDLKHGIGIHKTTSYRYDGYWLNGRRHGWGVLSKFSEENGYRIVYDGEWGQGKPRGHGIRQYSDGGYYNGDWKNGKRDGFGEMWYANEDYYGGLWLKDLKHGIGVYVYSNWKDDRKNGQGSLFNMNTGIVQQGLWRMDMCVQSEVFNTKYRQAAVRSTSFPIPKMLYLNYVFNEDDIKKLFGKLKIIS
ncbi:uncharacterized protein isoform X2 [Rhodnius prolixus]|uniref:uncharacterized protein isoform X2 n=1 Tax=Rhodnius prolixus TaxID=13249 RepID=UPI003D18C2EA